MILVSILLFLFTTHGIPKSVAMHLAVDTSLANIVATSASSLGAHAFLGGVLWDVFKPLAIGLAIGALLGLKSRDYSQGSFSSRFLQYSY